MKPYYDRGGITIYNEDCSEIIHSLYIALNNDIHIVTDPPYGIERFKKGFGYTRFKKYGVSKTGITWDKKPKKELIDDILSFGKYHIIWGANNFILPESQTFLVWDKEQTVPNYADCELAYCDIPSMTAKIFKYSIHKHNKSQRNHPTEKPIDLMIWCLLFLPYDEKIILDPFMGSGTTLVAAQRLGRRAIGIDISEEYCKIAVERLRQPSFFSIPSKSKEPKPVQLSMVGQDG